MKLQHLIYLTAGLFLGACGPQKSKAMEETEVLIETSMGDIRVKLYDDTPKHRDNFIKTARAGAYDNIVFHRVIKDFMVQTGDPAMKPAHGAPTVDTTEYQYTIPAEIVYPRHYHKRGALAAARQGDDVNPEKASSGTQFYIVTGRRFTAGQLVELYSAIYQNRIDSTYAHLARPHIKEMYLLRRMGETRKLEKLQDSIMEEAEKTVSANPPKEYTDAQKKTYTTVGGAPHLDGEYTVFGEVVEGIEVAEAISRVRTSKERPVKDVVIKKVTVLE